MLTVVASGKAAPGATTSAWALALAWPGELLMVDCDPAGGDMAPGLLPGRVVADRGLLSWSAAARGGVPAMAAAAMFAAHAVALPEWPQVWLVPGFTTATQSHSFTPEVWERLALALALARSSAAIGRDSLVDAGRLVGDRAPWPVLRAADQVIVTVRPTVRSVHAAQDATQRLRHELGDLAKVVALVVGDGPYSAAEVAVALALPLAGTLPYDRPTAQVLSDGAAGERGLHRSPLLRAAGAVAREAVRAAAAAAAGSAGTGMVRR